MKKTLFVLLGPTSIGKTNISIELAKQFNTEIISADSRQIYKELSIGTATPDPHQLNTVKHYLIQTHSIHNYYNASNYETDALFAINTVFEKKDVAILTGGSMMYIDVVCNGIDDLPTIDENIRKDVIARFEKFGLEYLRLELKKIDPEYYAQVDLKNPKRILHALEIFYTTGTKYSTLRTNQKKTRDFAIVKIGLNTERTILHSRINERVIQMIASGLVEEARSVYPFRKLNSLNTVGYKELFDYFDGLISLEDAIELIKRNTRRYARRQLTWFRKDNTITWFEPTQLEEIIAFAKRSIETLK